MTWACSSASKPDVLDLVEVAQVLRARVRVEDEEVRALGLGVEDGSARAHAAVRELRLYAGLEGIRRLLVEQVVDAGDRRHRRADAGLVEAAAAEAAAVAQVGHEVVVRLEAQRRLGLQVVPGFLAHLARERAGVGLRNCVAVDLGREELLRRLSRVLALVAVVAQRDRGLDPVGEVVADLAEHRPGQVVLRVGEDS